MRCFWSDFSLTRSVNLTQSKWQWTLNGAIAPALGSLLMLTGPGEVSAQLPKGSSQPPANQAIVQMGDLSLPVPVVQGEAVLPLEPMEPKSLLRVVSISIAGQARRFLLDTGASNTLVSPDWVEPLGRKGKPLAQNKLAVAGPNCPAPTMQVFDLPPLVLQTSLVRDLHGIAIAQGLIPAKLSGLLGMDVLRQYDLHITPQQLGLKAKTTGRPPGAIALRSKSGVLLAEVMLNGRGPFTMLVDTGAGSTFISPQVAETIALGKTEAIKMVGFCGEEAAKLGYLRRVSLGNPANQETKIERNQVEVVVTDSAVIKTMEIDGVLGQNFLSHYQQHWQVASGNKTGSWLVLTPLP
jgi:predicted aspartyl protease